MSLQNAWGFLGTETKDISNIRENMFTLNLIHGSILLVNPGIFLFPQYYAQELRIFTCFSTSELSADTANQERFKSSFISLTIRCTL